MKWKALAGVGIGLTLAATVPVNPVPMQWLVSYETIAFNTPNGDLALDEYAVAGDGEWYVRESVHKNFVVTTTEPKGKTLVTLRCEKCAYYSIFRTHDGMLLRVPLAAKTYTDLALVKNAQRPNRTELLPLLSPAMADAAIAFDGGSEASASDVTLVSSISWSHTVTSNTNGLISVATAATDGTDADRPVSGVTYNADALTVVREDDDALNNITTGIWRLVTPDTGTNTATITFTGTCNVVMGAAVSLTGVDQVTPVDNSNTLAGSEPVAPAVVTVADNAWGHDSSLSNQAVGAAYSDGGAQTALVAGFESTAFAYSSGYSGPLTPAGTMTHTWSCSGASCGSAEFIATIVSYDPAVAAGGGGAGGEEFFIQF